jgi:hypothetical protein
MHLPNSVDAPPKAFIRGKIKEKLELIAYFINNFFLQKDNRKINTLVRLLEQILFNVYCEVSCHYNDAKIYFEENFFFESSTSFFQRLQNVTDAQEKHLEAWYAREGYHGGEQTLDVCDRFHKSGMKWNQIKMWFDDRRAQELEEIQQQRVFF